MGNWWKERVFYQIYPLSFCDTNGDGYGDIPGITAKLDYLKQLGVGALWLSPVYRSPMADNGYDVSDYRDIDPRFGTMEDMERLIAEAKKRDFKLVMDLVMNHTSAQHEWFKKSCAGIAPYDDYYIWRPAPGKRKKPNNWNGFFGGGAWSWNEQRKAYYLHLFSEDQPDLNFRCPAVVEEVKEILRFWLAKGIDGFRCDMVNMLYKSSLENGKPRIFLRGLEHYLTQEGTHSILRELRRDVLAGHDCFLIGEASFADPAAARDLTGPQRGELDAVFAFEHMETDEFLFKWFRRRFSARRFQKTLIRWQRELPWNANYLENHDQPRSLSRFGADGVWRERSAKLLAALLLTLRGTPFLYQGEELGMTNADLPIPDGVRDKATLQALDIARRRLHLPKGFCYRMAALVGRDNGRTPMQWTAGENAGFTSGTPWIKVNDNFRTVNAAEELRDPDSVLNFYRKLVQLRGSSPLLTEGSFEPLASGAVFAYRRAFRGRSVVVALNFSPRSRSVPYRGELLLSNAREGGFDGALLPYEAVLLEEHPER